MNKKKYILVFLMVVLVFCLGYYFYAMKGNTQSNTTVDNVQKIELIAHNGKIIETFVGDKKNIISKAISNAEIVSEPPGDIISSNILKIYFTDGTMGIGSSFNSKTNILFTMNFGNEKPSYNLKCPSIAKMLQME